MGLSGVPMGTWAVAILSGVGAPDTANNRGNLAAWAACEVSGSSFNPFNTTLFMPGASCYNSVCVRNYVSFNQGVAATVSTIRQGNMAAIAGALRSNVSRQAFGAAVGGSPWGTSGACIAGSPVGPPPGGPPPKGKPPGPRGPSATQDWSPQIREAGSAMAEAGGHFHTYAQANLGLKPKFTPPTVTVPNPATLVWTPGKRLPA